MPRSITVLVNAAAGCDLKVEIADRLTSLFESHGAEVAVVLVKNCATLADQARRAVDAGAQTIVAVGGDGTVGSIAGALVDTDAALGIVPAGTLNHFAKDLRIPLDLEEAVQNIVHGHATRVDVGEVNGLIFVNNSSLGLYPAMVKRREQQQRLGGRKWSAFVRASLTALGRYPLIRVTIETDGVQITRKTPLVFIGNNHYHLEGLKVGTRDRIDSGRLSVYLTPNVGRLGRIWFAFRALFGRLRDEKDFAAFATPALSIMSRRRRMHVALDGEICRLEMPLEYRIRPAALQVIAPTPPSNDQHRSEPT